MLVPGVCSPQPSMSFGRRFAEITFLYDVMKFLSNFFFNLRVFIKE